MRQTIVRRLAIQPVVALLLLTLIGCGQAPPPSVAPAPSGDQPERLQLASRAFAPEETIPATYTCDGEDISPPLQWNGPPQGTQTLALIVDDPDAPGGTWTHWVLYSLSPDTTTLSEGVPPQAELPDGSRQGLNSWRRLGYGGPCPPSGSHRYVFRLYALDTQLDVPSGASKDQVLRAMEGHVLAQGELIGRYSRE
jgi:Raf kinase inhibitor-like YbhB/YbcL family protein